MDTYSKLEDQGERVFRFPDGIPGFDHIHEFVFLCKTHIRPFLFMHSVEEPETGFVCIDPCIVGSDCDSRVSIADMKILGLGSMDNAVAVGIVMIESEVEKSTVNLAGPIVVNTVNHIGKQVVCEGRGLSIRHRVLDGLVGERREEIFSVLLKMRLAGM